jgi:hypothetical protein
MNWKTASRLRISQNSRQGSREFKWKTSIETRRKSGSGQRDASSWRVVSLDPRAIVKPIRAICNLVSMSFLVFSGCGTTQHRQQSNTLELREYIFGERSSQTESNREVSFEAPVFVRTDSTAIIDLRSSAAGIKLSDALLTFEHDCIDLVYARGGLRHSDTSRLARIEGAIVRVGSLVADSDQVITNLRIEGVDLLPRCNYSAETYVLVKVTKLTFRLH